MIGLTDPVHGDDGRLTHGDRKIVTLLGDERRFTIPEAMARTGFTERGLRAILRRLLERGVVQRLQPGKPGSPAYYRVRRLETRDRASMPAGTRGGVVMT